MGSVLLLKISGVAVTHGRPATLASSPNSQVESIFVRSDLYLQMFPGCLSYVTIFSKSIMLMQTGWSTQTWSWSITADQMTHFSLIQPRSSPRVSFFTSGSSLSLEGLVPSAEAPLQRCPADMFVMAKFTHLLNKKRGWCFKMWK